MTQSEQPLQWSQVDSANKLKTWLSQATITKTIWGGRAFKTTSDTTAVNLNVVFAKLQKLLKQNPSPKELKEIINHFLKHDFTPHPGDTKEKELYIARFWGNTQTAKRTESLKQLISAQKETAQELLENQIISQGLKEALRSANIEKTDLDSLHTALTQDPVTPSSAAKAFQSFQSKIPNPNPNSFTFSGYEEGKTFINFIVKNGINSLFLQGVAQLLTISQTGAVSPAEIPKYSTAFSALKDHTSHFPRQALLALSKINWGEDVPQNQSLIESACTAMANMHPMDIQIFCKQHIEFDQIDPNQSKNFESFRTKLEEKFGNSFVKDETEYQESACLWEGLRTFCSACDMKEEDLNKLYTTLTNPDTLPNQAVTNLRNANKSWKKSGALKNLQQHLEANGNTSMYLRGIDVKLRENPDFPAEDETIVFRDFPRFLETFAAVFSRKTCLELSQIQWDKDVPGNNAHIEWACFFMNRSISPTTIRDNKTVQDNIENIKTLYRALFTWVSKNQEHSQVSKAVLEKLMKEMKKQYSFWCEDKNLE